MRFCDTTACRLEANSYTRRKRQGSPDKITYYCLECEVKVDPDKLVVPAKLNPNDPDYYLARMLGFKVPPDTRRPK